MEVFELFSPVTQSTLNSIDRKRLPKFTRIFYYRNLHLFTKLQLFTIFLCS